MLWYVFLTLHVIVIHNFLNWFNLEFLLIKISINIQEFYYQIINDLVWFWSGLAFLIMIWKSLIQCFLITIIDTDSEIFAIIRRKICIEWVLFSLIHAKWWAIISIVSYLAIKSMFRARPTWNPLHLFNVLFFMCLARFIKRIYGPIKIERKVLMQVVSTIFT